MRFTSITGAVALAAATVQAREMPKDEARAAGKSSNNLEGSFVAGDSN